MSNPCLSFCVGLCVGVCVCVCVCLCVSVCVHVPTGYLLTVDADERPDIFQVAYVVSNMTQLPLTVKNSFVSDG